MYTFRFVEYSEGSGPEMNLGGAQYGMYFSSQEQIAYFLTQEAVYILIHFKFLRVCILTFGVECTYFYSDKWSQTHVFKFKELSWTSIFKECIAVSIKGLSILIVFMSDIRRLILGMMKYVKFPVRKKI